MNTPEEIINFHDILIAAPAILYSDLVAETEFVGFIPEVRD